MSSPIDECGNIPSIVYTMIWHENPSLLTQIEIRECGMTAADATNNLGSLTADDSALEEITRAALLDNDGSLDNSAVFDCPWTTPVDPVHRPIYGPGPWTTRVDHPLFCKVPSRKFYL